MPRSFPRESISRTASSPLLLRDTPDVAISCRIGIKSRSRTRPRCDSPQPLSRPQRRDARTVAHPSASHGSPETRRSVTSPSRQTLHIFEGIAVGGVEVRKSSPVSNHSSCKSRAAAAGVPTCPLKSLPAISSESDYPSRSAVRRVTGVPRGHVEELFGRLAAS